MEILKILLVGAVTALTIAALILGAVLMFKKGMQGWLTQYWWPALIVLAVLVLGVGIWSLWGAHSTPSGAFRSPSLGTVWMWAQNHWLWIVLVGGAVYLASFFLPKESAVLQKTARVTALSVVIALFTALPIIFLIWGEKEGVATAVPTAVAERIPLASMPQSEWPKLVLPPHGKSRMVALPVGMVVKMNGNRFRLVNVYQDGRECSFGNDCPIGPPTRGVYALNEANETNIISYAYASQ